MNAPAGILRARPLLTRGQIQIVERAARGETAAEMAAALGLSVGGVDVSLARARWRIGARNTTHLVALAFAHGLVEPAQLRAVADAATRLGIGARR